MRRGERSTLQTDRQTDRQTDSVVRSVVPVMFLLNKVIASSECDEVSVVRWRWDGHAACTTHVRVTQLVGQHLNLIGAEMIVIPQHVVVRRTTRALRQHVSVTQC